MTAASLAEVTQIYGIRYWIDTVRQARRSQ